MELGIYGKVLFWVLIICIFVYEVLQILRGHSSNSWRGHPAKVTDIKVKTRIDEGTEVSKLYINYHYHYMGAYYRGSKVKYGDLWSTNYGKTSEFLAGITKGSEVTIYINPKNPSQSVLYKGHQGNIFWFFGFFAVFVLIALKS